MIIVTNPGTAHGKISMVRINFFPFILLSLVKIAKNIAKAICKVVATNVHVIVHVNTLKNVSRHSDNVTSRIKFSKPTQLSKLRGGALYRL